MRAKPLHTLVDRRHTEYRTRGVEKLHGYPLIPTVAAKNPETFRRTRREQLAKLISEEITGLASEGFGSMGAYHGFERRLPLITLELPKDEIDPSHWAAILLRTLGLSPRSMQ